MNKETMNYSIDKESGVGFHKNINLDGYNFHKNKSFVSFKITKVENVNIVNIRYFYADKTDDFKAILAYCCNFWMGMKIKFIYYKEKEKNPYVINTFRKLGFKIVDDKLSPDTYKFEFECPKCETNKCQCKTIEAYL